jgi:hypothetical protein
MTTCPFRSLFVASTKDLPDHAEADAALGVAVLLIVFSPILKSGRA